MNLSCLTTMQKADAREPTKTKLNMCGAFLIQHKRSLNSVSSQIYKRLENLLMPELKFSYYESVL